MADLWCRSESMLGHENMNHFVWIHWLRCNTIFQRLKMRKTDHERPPRSNRDSNDTQNKLSENHQNLGKKLKYEIKRTSQPTLKSKITTDFALQRKEIQGKEMRLNQGTHTTNKNKEKFLTQTSLVD